MKKRFLSKLISILLFSVLNSALIAKEEIKDYKEDLDPIVLELIVEKGIDNETSEIGDIFSTRILNNIYSQKDNILLISKGSWITATVSENELSNMFNKSSKLTINIDYLIIPNGNLIPINSQISFQSDKTNNDEKNKEKNMLGIPVLITSIIKMPVNMLKEKPENLSFKEFDKLKIYINRDFIENHIRELNKEF